MKLDKYVSESSVYKWDEVLEVFMDKGVSLRGYVEKVGKELGFSKVGDNKNFERSDYSIIWIEVCKEVKRLKWLD